MQTAWWHSGLSDWTDLSDLTSCAGRAKQQQQERQEAGGHTFSLAKRGAKSRKMSAAAAYYVPSCCTGPHGRLGPG